MEDIKAVKLSQSLKHSQPMLPALSPLFLKVTSHSCFHSLPILPRENGAHRLCHQRWTGNCNLRRELHSAILHLLEQWAIWLDLLRDLNVNTSASVLDIPMSQILPDTFFSQKREVHAAVVVKTNTIIIVGGYDERPKKLAKS